MALAGFTSRPGFKFFLVGLLGLLLMIPLLIVYALIYERQSRASTVANEIGRDWGGEQTLSGPWLVLPYTALESFRDGQTWSQRTVHRHAVFSIDDLTVSGASDVQVRRRSIFEVPAYRARISIAGRFSGPDLAPLQIPPENVLWNDATLVLLIEDARGIKEPVALVPEGGAAIPFRPSLGPGLSGRGIHAPLGGLDPRRGLSFSFDLVLNGTTALWVAPAARDTKVRLSGNWPHPSYGGAFLPDERSEPGPDFSAQWRIPDLARNLPPSWLVVPGSSFMAGDQVFGVKLYQHGTVYQYVERSVKYGVMFIGAIFVAVFLMEVRSGRSVHPVQYIMVGLALILFFVILLALAEHVGFFDAYIAASVATVGLISLYGGLAMRSPAFGLVLAAVLGALLGLLYIIMTLEDYSLLAGAAASFLALAILMLATTRIDWSAPQAKER